MKAKYETLQVLRKFQKGSPNIKWAIYSDGLLGKETILNSEGDSPNEKLFNGELRYTKLSEK